MNTFLIVTAFLILGVAYVCLGAWLVHRQVRPIYGYFRYLAALDAVKERYDPDTAIESLERAVYENPDSVSLRCELQAAFIEFSGGAAEFTPRIKENLFWLSKNAPLETLEHDSTQVLKAASAEEKDAYKKIWESSIAKHGRSREILRKAAAMNLDVNIDFCLECLREAYKQDCLDFDTFSTLTHWMKHGMPTADSKEIAKLKLNRYKVQYRIPWDDDDYAKFLILKAKTFAWLWPRPVEFLVLAFLGHCRGTPWRKNPGVLADYAEVAIDAGDIESARFWIRLVDRFFPELENFHSDGVEPFGTPEILDVLIRFALIESDDERLKRYLDYRAGIPFENVFLLQFWDKKMLISLIENGKSQLAADYLEKRVGEKETDPYLAEQIKLLRNGKTAFDDQKQWNGRL